MTKKDDEESFDIDIFDASPEELEAYMEKTMQKIDEEDKREKLEANKLKIQPVEEYLQVLGYTSERLPKRIFKEYPDLFSVKVKDKTDMLSEIPGIEASAATQLLASLMTAESEAKRKKWQKKKSTSPSTKKE